MFKKIVSNIPFNPSLIDHLPDLRESLRREKKLRTLGLGVFGFALLLQLFVTVFPNQTKNNISPNDLLGGGFQTKSQAMIDCNNINDFQKILKHFYISCQSLINDENVSLGYSSNLYSINRLAYNVPGQSLLIINDHQYWARPFSSGSSLSTLKQLALAGYTQKGYQYYIIYRSGDLVISNQAITTDQCGQNCISESMTVRDLNSSDVNNSTVRPNDTLIYTLESTNLGTKALKGYKFESNFSNALLYSRVLNLYGGNINDGIVSWKQLTLFAGQSITKSVALIVDNKLPNTALSTTDPYSYNMTMNSVYGNPVTVKLPYSFTKSIELNINNSLPSSGKLISLILVLVIFTLISYMFYRSKVVLREISNIKDDYLSGGKD